MINSKLFQLLLDNNPKIKELYNHKNVIPQDLLNELYLKVLLNEYFKTKGISLIFETLKVDDFKKEHNYCLQTVKHHLQTKNYKDLSIFLTINANLINWNGDLLKEIILFKL